MPDVGKALEMARQLALQKANAGNALSLQGMLGANPEPGKVYRAVVERCQTFGAFCKTEPEGFSGMIHTSEFGIREFRRYEGPQDVEAVVPPGSRVYVLCKEIKDGNKVALSLDGVNQENGTYDVTKTKRYQNDNARDKPPPAVGSIHRGAVKRIESYGAFVTLEGFSDGMVHVSQLSRSQRFYDARDIEQAFPLGGPIFVQVVQVKEGNRVELSAQDVDQATGQALPPRHQHQGPRGTLPDVGVVLRGQVKRLEGYGVFVALPPPHNMDGLVHVSRIHPDGARLNDAGDVAQFAPVGAEVYVFVQGYKDGGKLELSMARVDQATGQLKPEMPRPPPMPSHGMIDPYAPAHGMVDPYAQMAQYASAYAQQPGMPPPPGSVPPPPGSVPPPPGSVPPPPPPGPPPAANVLPEPDIPGM
jgi:predicted RNA-binding protein with RPS1 domain